MSGGVSLQTVRVLCHAGCGAYGDEELDYLCMDCHADQLEIQRKQLLQDELDKRRKTQKTEELRHCGPPAIDHVQGLTEFFARPREKDHEIIVRENSALARELEIRHSSISQLRKYMIATNLDDPVDSKEWGRYKFADFRAIPDQTKTSGQEERLAQIKLFCAWKRRQTNRRIEALRQATIQKKVTGRVSTPSAFAASMRHVASNSALGASVQKVAANSSFGSKFTKKTSRWEVLYKRAVHVEE